MIKEVREFFKEQIKRLTAEQRTRKTWRIPNLCPKNKEGNYSNRNPKWHASVVQENKLKITALFNLYHAKRGQTTKFHVPPLEGSSWSRASYDAYYTIWEDRVKQIEMNYAVKLNEIELLERIIHIAFGAPASDPPEYCYEIAARALLILKIKRI